MPFASRSGGARPRWLVPAAIAAGVLLLLVVPIVASYNGLVTKQESADQSFADLDTQIQRRNDLIPNLVNAVRGILNQEQEVFGELARASGRIEAGIGRLLAIVENFPELRSSENVLDLQTQLEGTENRIAQARRDYNGAVTDYNVSTRRFPRSIVAGLFGFDRKPLFEAEPEAREVPEVDLGGSSTPR
jgi:LemA protein